VESQAAYSPIFHYISSGLLKLALQTLKSSPFVAALSDKAGGFVLCEKTLFNQERRKIMDKANYEKVACSKQSLIEDTFTEFRILLRKQVFELPLESESQRELMGIFLRPFQYHSTNLVSILKVTVKSHKEDGKVSMRPIHAASRSPFSAAAKFIIWCLQPLLREAEHLMSSSRDIVKVLRRKNTNTT
jgi:hypothetical protein